MIIKSLLFTLIFFNLSTAMSSDWRINIIRDTQLLYTDVAETTFNKSLIFEIEESSIVGGSAHHDFDVLRIKLNQGLLDSPRLTPDGLRMLICHELGHLFGGSPRKSAPFEWEGPYAEDGLSFLSSEGQADYYAAVSCFTRLSNLTTHFFEKFIDHSRVGPNLKKKCSILLSTEKYLNCLRSALAGEDFLKITHEFPISCEYQDDEIAQSLIRDSYPSRQCRLDTIINGSLCSENLPLTLDFSHSNRNSCPDDSAARPACWFVDSND